MIEVLGFNVPRISSEDRDSILKLGLLDEKMERLVYFCDICKFVLIGVEGEIKELDLNELDSFIRERIGEIK